MRAEGEAREVGSDSRLRRLAHLVPIGVILAILAVVGVVGFGGSSSPDRGHVDRDVTALLSGIPQHGTALGSPEAPISLVVFADLECPTVERFATAYLPSIIDTWVRSGRVKLLYRSLRTDTDDERTFFRQEAAALAAGRQAKLWNYALTFIYEQGTVHTDYADDDFLKEVASQVPRLDLRQWGRDRADPVLATRVANELHYARTENARSTPSFLIGLTTGPSQSTNSPLSESAREEFRSSLSALVAALGEEEFGDDPTLGNVVARKET